MLNWNIFAMYYFSSWVFIRARQWSNWLFVWKILPAWFVHLRGKFCLYRKFSSDSFACLWKPVTLLQTLCFTCTCMWSANLILCKPYWQNRFDGGRMKPWCVTIANEAILWYFQGLLFFTCLFLVRLTLLCIIQITAIKLFFHLVHYAELLIGCRKKSNFAGKLSNLFGLLCVFANCLTTTLFLTEFIICSLNNNAHKKCTVAFSFLHYSHCPVFSHLFVLFTNLRQVNSPNSQDRFQTYVALTCIWWDVLQILQYFACFCKFWEISQNYLKFVALW